MFGPNTDPGYGITDGKADPGKGHGGGKTEGEWIMTSGVTFEHVSMLVRTGLPAKNGKPGSKAFKFDHVREVPKCRKLAEKWLQEMGV